MSEGCGAGGTPQHPPPLTAFSGAAPAAGGLAPILAALPKPHSPEGCEHFSVSSSLNLFKPSL